MKELLEILTRQRGDRRHSALTWDDAEDMKAETKAEVKEETPDILNSPEFTGKPTAPTAPPETSSDQLATTKFVSDAIFEAVRELRREMDTP